MIRLKDIAKELDLSISVVSKVINNSKGTAVVSPATTKRIRETAQRMGYLCNRTAVALRSGSQQAIGLLLHPMGAAGSEMTEDLLKGAAQEMSAHEQRMELVFYQNKAEFMKQMRRMGPTRVDGLIVAGLDHDYLNPALRELAQEGVPIVTILSEPVSSAIPNVGCGDMEGSRLATEHLIEQGCERIAQIGKWDLRLQGYVQALRAHGRTPDDSLIYQTDRSTFTAQVGEEGVAAFVARGVQYDGLVCQCDIYAMGAMRALARLGRSIPNQVKVIGFDNAPICEHLAEPLSSVSLELRDRARRAVLAMIRLQHGGSIDSIQVPPRVVHRASSRLVRSSVK
ncbi:MAG: LacI family DNA-binding transcriptional regulator [Planctomycetota bacterium]